MAEQWKKLADLAGMAEGALLALTVGRMEFLVLRSGEEVSVFANRCPHEGCRLSGGLIRGGALLCPCHGARFELPSGRLLSPPSLDGLVRFAVKVENGAVFVGPPQPAERKREHRTGSVERGAPRTVVIIGGGAAGNSCAETLRGEGYDGLIQLLTEEADLPCYRPALSKGLLSGQSSESSLSLRSREFYESGRIDILHGRRATGVDFRSRRVECADGEVHPFDAVLVATGAAARRPKVQGIDLDGVFFLRSRADGAALAARARESRSAVLIGAGFLCLEAASSLRALGMDVSVVSREPLPLSAAFGTRVAARLLRLHQAAGVRLTVGATVTRIVGDGRRVRGVALSDGTELEADIVVVGVGMEPAVGFLQGTGLLRDGAVVVDRSLATSAPGVYAAGDAALVPYGRDGERALVGHWVDAERQGQAAARAILGLPGGEFTDERFFWTEQSGQTLAAVGTTGGREPDEVLGSIEEGDFLAAWFSGGTLAGAAALGYGGELAALALDMRDGRAVSPGELEISVRP